MPQAPTAKSVAVHGRRLGWILPGANFAVEHGGELYLLIVAVWRANCESNRHVAIGIWQIARYGWLLLKSLLYELVPSGLVGVCSLPWTLQIPSWNPPRPKRPGRRLPTSSIRNRYRSSKR